MAASFLREDCIKVVFRIENHEEALIDLHYANGDKLFISSELSRPQHAKHSFETCPEIEIKTEFHPQRGDPKRTLRALWDWVLQYLSLRTVPVFINFSDAHPSSVRALLMAVKCSIIPRMRTHGHYLASVLKGKDIPEIYLVESQEICLFMPAVPKITVDATRVAEHRDYRALLQPTTTQFHYIANMPEFTEDNWDALFGLNVDHVVIQQEVSIAKEICIKEGVVIALKKAVFGVLHNSHRAHANANARNIEVQFAIKISSDHMALLQSYGFASKPLSLGDVRHRMLLDPFIAVTLLSLHHNVGNITFKIVFGCGDNMETVVDDTLGADPAYNMNTLVNIDLAYSQGWW